jgi:hypothetical protein
MAPELAADGGNAVQDSAAAREEAAGETGGRVGRAQEADW